MSANTTESSHAATRSIVLPRPRIYTGPKHQTVDEATASYLREAAQRVRDNRYWGSGVTALVADLLDSAAEAVELSTPPAGGED